MYMANTAKHGESIDIGIAIKYTSHHRLSVLQPSNFSMYHIIICLLILVGMLSATALLQHGIPFLPYLH